MPEAIMVVDWLDRESGLFVTILSQCLKVETTLPTKVQWPLGFVYIKAVLRLHFAVNEKTQRHYTLLSTSKRCPQSGTVCFKTTYQGKN